MTTAAVKPLIDLYQSHFHLHLRLIYHGHKRHQRLS